MNRASRPISSRASRNAAACRLLARVYFAAGKGDLTGMRAQMRRAKGEQNGEAVGARDDGREHRGGARAGDDGRGGRQAVESEVAGFRRAYAGQIAAAHGRVSSRQGAKGVGSEREEFEIAQRASISLAGHIGKKTRLERTPNHPPSPRRSVVPRSTRS